MPIDDGGPERGSGFARGAPGILENHTHYHLHLAKGSGDQAGDSGAGGARDSGDDHDSHGSKGENETKPERDGEQSDSSEGARQGRDEKGKDRDEKGKGSGEKEKGGKDDKDGNGKPQQVRNKTPLIILAIVVVLAAIVAFFVWFAKRNQVTTDDAYTDGNTITMAPKVSGYVTALYINDNMHVRKGDLLLRIEQDDYVASQAQAQASLASAQAQLEAARVAYDIARVQYPAQLVAAKAQQRAAEASLLQARAAYKRQHEVDPRATTQENIDVSDSQSVNSASSVASAKSQVAVAELVTEQVKQAEATVQQRVASVAQAEAQLKQANLNFGYTEVRAPSDGFITKRNVQLGSYLTAGTTLFLIVTPEVWITANYKESQLGRIQPGDAVDIGVDAYSGLELHGHVQSIQYGSGSVFSAFPVENATGNYVKIVQRVPVKIIIDRGLDPNRQLPLGLSVSPVVYVR